MVLNVKKTKEMVFDFRKRRTEIAPLKIADEDVDIVTEYKYLGTYIDSKLEPQHKQNVLKRKPASLLSTEIKIFSSNWRHHAVFLSQCVTVRYYFLLHRVVKWAL